MHAVIVRDGGSYPPLTAQHFLYFLPLPHEQGAFGLGFLFAAGRVRARVGSGSGSGVG